MKIKPEKFLGYIEYLKDGYRHSVSLVFECKIIGEKEPRAASQASEISFFARIPKKTIKEQKKFLKRFHKE